MAATTRRSLILAAVTAWSIVAGSGIRTAVVDDGGDDWEGPYLVFSVALLVGAILAVLLAARLTRSNGHDRLRMAGLAVASIGVLASVVAWALPLWMTILGVGFALLAFASVPRQRPPLIVLAGAQLVGMAALFVGLIGELGREDEWGDHPVGGGVGLVLTAALVITGIIALGRTEELLPSE